uniref:hypothetical protein n=1 Tax=Amycolatopsis sp. CA-096443 TaxID=3239919 RepID=UPI003F4949EC
MTSALAAGVCLLATCAGDAGYLRGKQAVACRWRSTRRLARRRHVRLTTLPDSGRQRSLL